MQTNEERAPTSDYKLDQELTDTLIAISVVARRLARKLEQEAREKREKESNNE